MHHVFVLGAGGVGSYLIPLLQRHLSVDDVITVMDGDVFEKKNMDRQLFARRVLGMNKATAMSEMYPQLSVYPRVEAIESYLVASAAILEYSKAHEVPVSLIIACPDNHPARLKCLQAADDLCIPAIICGNELESGGAMLYFPKYRGTKADPRIAYPSLLTGTEGDPTHACTGVAQSENKQLAVANFISAGFAVSLAYKAVISPVDDNMLKELPFEFLWTSWGLRKSEKISDKLEG